MGLVLTLIGVFVYERTQGDLDRQIDRELSARLAGVLAIVRDDGDDLGDPEQDPLGRVDAEGVVQVLGPDGEVADATASQLDVTPLVAEPELAGLLAGEAVNLPAAATALDDPLRIVGARTQDDGVPYVALVGASLAARNDALESLARLLLIGGPVALLIATAAGYWLATAALRPVESMRRQAMEISEKEPGLRLPVPRARDEIADLGETLNAMLTRLEHALEHERRFVADASHELRTPLAILRAEVELALEEGQDPAELRAALLSVGDETDRLAKLAEDLLVVARSEEGQLPVALQRVSVAELCARVTGRFSARERGSTPIPVRDVNGLVVRGDPLRLEQALSNLVENALKYGGEPVEVAVSEAGDQLEFHVLDRGQGFSPEMLDRAFDRFARSDRTGPRAGAGLGLAIVEAIARAHGGSAHADNREGGGADVWFAVPRRD